MKIPSKWIESTYKNDDLESYVYNDFLIFVNLESSPVFTIQSLKDYENCDSEDLFTSDCLEHVKSFLNQN